MLIRTTYGKRKQVNKKVKSSLFPPSGPKQKHHKIINFDARDVLSPLYRQIMIITTLLPNLRVERAFIAQLLGNAGSGTIGSVIVRYKSMLNGTEIVGPKITGSINLFLL